MKLNWQHVVILALQIASGTLTGVAAAMASGQALTFALVGSVTMSTVAVAWAGMTRSVFTPPVPEVAK